MVLNFGNFIEWHALISSYVLVLLAVFPPCRRSRRWLRALCPVSPIPSQLDYHHDSDHKESTEAGGQEDVKDGMRCFTMTFNLIVCLTHELGEDVHRNAKPVLLLREDIARGQHLGHVDRGQGNHAQRQVQRGVAIDFRHGSVGGIRTKPHAAA